jgi:glycosyltransferase involved in cell wall biosynthesis
VRVALATPTYWPEVRRGAERFVRELAEGLAERGHEPVIVTTHPGRPGRGTEDGIDVIRAWRAPDGRLRRRMYEDHVTAIPALHLALRAAGPDVVIATHATAAVAAERHPTVFAYMGIPHRQSLVNRRARLSLVTRAATRAVAVTALSRHAAAVFREHLGVDSTVIPPGVDTSRFTPDPARRDPAPTIVCAADAQEPRKRVALLQEAVRRMDGVQLLLDARTATTDAVDMSDLPAVYRRAWVSALPSWGEAFGLVLAEALACGTAVVGADREGIPEVLGEQAVRVGADGAETQAAGPPPVGALFEGDDPDHVKQALQIALELSRDPATAEACRARAERFSTTRCAATYDTLLTHAARGT